MKTLKKKAQTSQWVSGFEGTINMRLVTTLGKTIVNITNKNKINSKKKLFGNWE